MSNKNIKQYTQTLVPEETDGALLQRGNDYMYAEHIDLMMGIQRVVLTLTQAQIKLLDAASSPVTIVAAQGAGLVIEPLACAVFLDNNGTNYATATTLRLKHSGNSNLMMSSSASFITSATDRYEKMVVAATDATNQQMFANTALVVDANANAANDGGTITLDLLYIVKKFA